MPPRVRVEVRAGDRVISEPVSASYGFEEATRDVQNQLAEGEAGVSRTEPNTVTLMLIGETGTGEASIHLLDAVTGAELNRLETVQLAISL